MTWEVHYDGGYNSGSMSNHTFFCDGAHVRLGLGRCDARIGIVGDVSIHISGLPSGPTDLLIDIAGKEARLTIPDGELLLAHLAAALRTVRQAEHPLADDPLIPGAT